MYVRIEAGFWSGGGIDDNNDIYTCKCWLANGSVIGSFLLHGLQGAYDRHLLHIPASADDFSYNRNEQLQRLQ